jgi:hypothetical protein
MSKSIMTKEQDKKFSYWAFLVYGFYSYYRRRDNAPMVFTVMVLGLVLTSYLLSLINIYVLLTENFSINKIIYLSVYFGSIIIIYFSIAFDTEIIESYFKYFDRMKYNKQLSSRFLALIVGLVGFTMLLITVFFLREAMHVV